MLSHSDLDSAQLEYTKSEATLFFLCRLGIALAIFRRLNLAQPDPLSHCVLIRGTELLINTLGK